MEHVHYEVHECIALYWPVVKHNQSPLSLTDVCPQCCTQPLTRAVLRLSSFHPCCTLPVTRAVLCLSPVLYSASHPCCMYSASYPVIRAVLCLCYASLASNNGLLFSYINFFTACLLCSMFRRVSLPAADAYSAIWAKLVRNKHKVSLQTEPN